MTGQCYYCAKGEHFECDSEVCTCCGDRNLAHRLAATKLAQRIRKYLKATSAIKPRPEES
jgi:hypothetical protein